MSDPSEAVVDRVADLLHERIGLRAEAGLRGRLRRSVRDDAAAHRLDISGYVEALAGDPAMLQSLYNRVTVQETSFFRHPEQFDVLLSHVLPGLRRPVTIWSAGCANGQEAYSLAMLLEEQDVEGCVLATDLSTSALARTAAGRYAPREITGLSSERIRRHLRRSGDTWEVSPRLRARVRPLNHNLLDPFARMDGSCHLVFCRNVLIYFSAEHTRLFLHRVADALPPGGALFLGAAESLWQATDRFDTVRAGETFFYRPAAIRTPPARRTPQPTHQPASHPRRRRTSPARAAAAPVPVQRRDVTLDAATLETAGQEAMAASNPSAAIIAFRKCAYLEPGNAMHHVNLGLACEAGGDHPAAQRAYAVARLAILEAADAELSSGGYTNAELLKLLDHREQALA